MREKPAEQAPAGSKRCMILVEGFRPDRSLYLYDVLRTFLNYLSLEADGINFESLHFSALSSGSTRASIYSQEKQFKDMFLLLASMLREDAGNFLFVCDSRTGFFERRRDAFCSYYDVSTNFALVVEIPGSFFLEIEDVPGLRTTHDAAIQEITERLGRAGVRSQASRPALRYLREKYVLIDSKGSFMERTCGLLSDLRKTFLLYDSVHLPLDIYLSSHHSSLSLTEMGYTVFYSQHTPVLPLLLRLLARTNTKKKWTIYFCTYAQTQASKEKAISKRKDSVRITKSELKFKRELKFFCESEKITRVIFPGNEQSRETVSLVANAVKIEARPLAGERRTKELIESILLVEGMDKTLVVSPASMMRALICYIKRKGVEEARKQAVPMHTVVKLAVKGADVKERKYFLTKMSV